MKISQLKLLVKKIVKESVGLHQIKDPSKNEMLNYLSKSYGREEGFADDAEIAMYWFASFYHGGQSSNLYSVLSTSRYRPGPIAKGPEPQTSEEMMYEDLVLEFAKGSEEANEFEKKHASLNENFSATPKNQALIEKWMKEGNRKAAIKIIDSILRQQLGISSSDLPDTATFANGVDGVEGALNNGDFKGALKIGFETAKDMVAEEGGEGLMEGFQKQTSGDLKIYKDIEGGQDVYWMDNKDSGGKILIKPESVQKYINRGYRLIDMTVNEGDEADESNPKQKFKDELYAALAQLKFRQLGNEPRTYMELYLHAFATVFCMVDLGDNVLLIQRFYDSERLDSMPGYHIEKKVPLPDNLDSNFITKVVKVCEKLVESIRSGETLLGDVDALQEDDEADTVNDMWYGNETEEFPTHQARPSKLKTPISKTFLKSKQPVQGLDWPGIKQRINKGTLKEISDDDVDYVEYHSQRKGEAPFVMKTGDGQAKFEYVNAKYPSGKIDIGVYAFRGDIVYGYQHFNKIFNIGHHPEPKSTK